MSNQQPAVTFEEIRALVRTYLPGPDLEAGTAALQRERQLTKPPGSLGRLEEIAQWMATWQGEHPADLRRPRVAVFAGNHGVAARGVSAYPAEVTAQMVANFQNGGAAVNRLCEVADADLRVYELDLENPTADFTQGPAMGEEDCCRTMAYGMMAVEMGVQLLALGEMGIANSTSAAAMCLALFGGEAADWTGRGTGIDDAGLARKIAAVEAGVAANPQAKDDPFETLRCLWAVTNSPPSPAPSWPPASPGCRCCSTVSPAPPPPRCCSRPTAARSTIAWSPTARSSRATPA